MQIETVRFKNVKKLFSIFSSVKYSLTVVFFFKQIARIKFNYYIYLFIEDLIENNFNYVKIC